MAGEKGNKPCSFMARHQAWFMVFIAFVELAIVCGPTHSYSILFISLREDFGAGATLTGNQKLRVMSGKG